MVFASRLKRARSSVEAETCWGSTLTATSRPRRVSRARYTSPMPPAPRSARISYGPRRVPGRSATRSAQELERMGRFLAQEGGDAPEHAERLDGAGGLGFAHVRHLPPEL